ncbi:MAG: response regulator transcription factor [Desulfobacterales bacterium]|uniref:Response regulator transcription factor n=1 Tax=Candidatus Desulfaltia bathyphila TaxID=2841697 RepID=A0A8J6T7U7_9BACT|nr:response regulator transcription factor [Candidatus Desulfaltia bathyphila]MBL7195309.1 response regulator transcription factor [Desulfobacterales bacterium]MBL7207223.1 response regulator transcription factor [Desulfobacterales bacterium]
MKDSDKKRILVIEDEKHIAEGLKLNLSFQGYDVKIAGDGVSGLQEWKRWMPALIILDIMLPDIDGLSVLQNIRLEDERIPILILSAKGSPDDKIKGFSYGVDDYLSKPFNLEEFLMRVERLLVRASWHRGGEDISKTDFSISMQTYNFGGNRIDFETSITYCKCGKVKLTGQEVKLLKLFIANEGKPLSRGRLLEIGWGYARGTTTRTVDNFIVRFRKYFEDDPKKPVYFKSVRSVGYVFNHN